MRNNRRRHSEFNAVNGRLVAFALIMLVIVAGGALVNLSLRSRISSLNKDIKRLEGERDALAIDLNREETNWSRISTPKGLDRALAKFGVEMTPSRKEDIVRLNVTTKGIVDVPEVSAYASK